MKEVREIDPEVADLLEAESESQDMSINLIAPGNFVPVALLRVLGSIINNAVVAGYPGNRNHAGTKFMDAIETLAVERAKKLFGAEHANVQPHSGALANFAVFYAVLSIGDRILHLARNQGGHSSHGEPASISGRYYETIPYHLSPRDERIDYDEVRDLAKKYRPHMIIAGSNSYPRVIDFATFGEIAGEVGAYLLVDMAQISGLVATGFHPNPCPYADFVTSSLRKTLRGGKGGFILCKKKFADSVDRAVTPGIQASEIPVLVATKAVNFKYAMSDGFKQHIERVCLNNKVLASSLQELGYKLVTGGTDNHIILIDLQDKGITGRQARDLLEDVGIFCNQNVMPFEEDPTATSGIRIGSGPMTARGFGGGEFEITARLVDRALDRNLSLEGREEIKTEVSHLCRKYPVYLPT